MTYSKTVTLNFVGFNLLVVVLYSGVLLESLNQVEDEVSRDFIEQETEVFLQSYTKLGGRAPLPFSRQLQSYYSDSDNLPNWLSDFAPGYYETESYHLSVANLDDGRRFYLLFDESQGFLDQNETLIDSLLLLVSLIVIGAGILISLVQSRILAAPIELLTQRVLTAGTTQPKIIPLPRNDELGQLSRAYSELIERLAGFIERERDFTRHASHELRTPLTVVRNNLELIQQADADPPLIERSINRMETAVQRMERQITILLLLGREETLPAVEEAMDVVGCLSELFSDYPQLRVHTSQREVPVLFVDPVVFVSVVDNLLRNVIEHGEHIDGVYPADLELTASHLMVTNPTAKRPPYDQSRSFGLTINTKLCAAVGWQFTYSAHDGTFRATVDFTPQV